MTTEQASFTVGDMVRAERHRRKLSQRALAKRAGVSVPAIQSIETGRHLPRLSTLNKLASAMRCPVAKFLPVAA
jgi:transcriptional regulator with XRE-family HTH domain